MRLQHERRPETRPQEQPTPLLTITDAAEYARKHKDTIQKAMARFRKDPSDPKGLRCLGTRTTKEWVDEWLERQSRRNRNS
jgi:hypothetical protein